MTRAIVCGSGGFRTIFIQGVLSALETAGFRADAYAGTSASAMTAAAAAVGVVNHIGKGHWHDSLDLKTQPGNGMSDVMLAMLDQWGVFLRDRVFGPDAPRLLIPASAVTSQEAAEITQSRKARRLGRNLLIAAARGSEHSWVDDNLASRLFDTASSNETLRLTPDNFAEVLYASTRMMHAWDIPATIGGQPYVDASYTCAIPAVEVAALGYDEVILIPADPGPVYGDIFGGRTVPETTPYSIIRPEIDPADLGADFTQATKAGLDAAFQHGVEIGEAFLAGRDG